MRNERRMSGWARGDVPSKGGKARIAYATHLPEGPPRPYHRRWGQRGRPARGAGPGSRTLEAEPIWTEFLRKLTRRGLRGVKLVVSDAHGGICARHERGAACTS